MSKGFNCKDCTPFSTKNKKLLKFKLTIMELKERPVNKKA